jgi:hypothetical protein
MTSAEDTLRDLKIALPDYILDASYAMQPRAPMRWIIDELISESSVNVWVGKYGSKKTWAALSAAVCVALGKDWLDHPTIQVNVLYIDEDMGESYLTERINQTIRGEQGGENTPLKYCSMHGFDLRSSNSINELQTLIEAGEFKLVFIDALCNVMPGADENSVKDVTPIHTNLRRLADCTGASFVMLHHTNKAGEYRGSSAIPGGVEQMLLIKSDEASEFINFETGKHRRGKPVKLAAVATWVKDADQFYLSAVPVPESNQHHSKAERFVLRYLEEHGASPVPNIENSADTCAPSTARSAVYSLTDKGEIKRINPGELGIGAAAIYDLVKHESTV